MTGRYRVVVDTSTFISAAILSGTPAQVFEAVCRNDTLLFSTATYAELHEVLHRPKFDRYIDLTERGIFLDSALEAAEFVAVTTSIARCRDPKDDKFLALAIDGNADYLITSDNDLLDLVAIDTKSRVIPILSPAAFYSTVHTL